MLIILEGPDGAGKSYLENALRERLARTGHVSRLHAKPPRMHPLDEYVSPLLWYDQTLQNHVICDRWHWGEAIYPHVFNRPTSYDAATHRYTEMFLQSRGAIVVFVFDDVSVMQSRVGPGRDDFVRSEHIPELMRRYTQVAMQSILPVIWWKSIRVDVDAIIYAAMQATRDAQRLAPWVTYLGPPNPNFLLLGENRGCDSDTMQPAFMPFATTSGHFLLSHYTQMYPNIGDPRIGIANACDVDRPQQLWNSVGCPPVVTLGRAAHQKLSRLMIPHGAMPHPQYIRRFHHRHGERYVEMLMKTMYDQEDRSQWRPLSLSGLVSKTTGS